MPAELPLARGDLESGGTAAAPAATGDEREVAKETSGRSCALRIGLYLAITVGVLVLRGTTGGHPTYELVGD